MRQNLRHSFGVIDKKFLYLKLITIFIIIM